MHDLELVDGELPVLQVLDDVPRPLTSPELLGEWGREEWAGEVSASPAQP
jgi:hypothetical protein